MYCVVFVQFSAHTVSSGGFLDIMSDFSVQLGKGFEFCTKCYVSTRRKGGWFITGIFRLWFNLSHFKSTSLYEIYNSA